VSYGTDAITGTTRCGYASIGSSDNAVNNWGLFQNTFCLVSLILIFLISIRIYIFTKYSENENSESLKTLLLYPTAMFICWFPSQFYNTLHKTTSETTTNLTIGNALHILAPLYGLLLSLIFYTKTDKARTEWKNILTSLKLIQKSNEVELRESSQSISSDMSVGDVVKNNLIVRILE